MERVSQVLWQHLSSSEVWWEKTVWSPVLHTRAEKYMKRESWWHPDYSLNIFMKLVIARVILHNRPPWHETTIICLHPVSVDFLELGLRWVQPVLASHCKAQVGSTFLASSLSQWTGQYLFFPTKRKTQKDTFIHASIFQASTLITSAKVLWLR